MIEPAVEPAEPPGNMSATISIAAAGAATIHVLKSVLANPVVVMIETVWNTASRIASSPSLIPASQRIAASTAEASARRPMYMRNSSSRTSETGFLRTNAR